MTKRNEQTSERIAKTASEIMKFKPMNPIIAIGGADGWVHHFRWKDIVAVAASCLTQAPDRKKPTRSKRPSKVRGRRRAGAK